jgi:hypothetical protein
MAVHSLLFSDSWVSIKNLCPLKIEKDVSTKDEKGKWPQGYHN